MCLPGKTAKTEDTKDEKKAKTKGKTAKTEDSKDDKKGKTKADPSGKVETAAVTRIQEQILILSVDGIVAPCMRDANSTHCIIFGLKNN
ncbi:hypothetical protein Y032_0023g745 [Ancylostoma ceylanicum]|uniref:Uncharacterized protein n=1 Tax=Ancylostoma ceylanicum TaxID=53326 RepID=A0A016UYG8_9BILA|nr:hypothetical protein Y032_0023g745 [Ancylostoma ceylanicum]